MESSTSSFTFKGSISEAITESKMKRKLFLVYISGQDENSIVLEKSTWIDPSVAESISRNCIFLHLKEGSVDAANFCAIYPQQSVPSISAIDYNGGKLLWQHEGYVSSEDLVRCVEKACENLHLKENLALLTAALASKKPEPSSSINPNASFSEQGSMSSTDIESSSSENPQAVTSRPFITSKLPGEDQNIQVSEETSSQQIQVNEPELGCGQSISASETAKDLLGSNTINTENSQVKSGSSQAEDGYNTAAQESINLNSHSPGHTLGISNEVCTEHTEVLTRGKLQEAANEENCVDDKKSDGLVGGTNTTKSDDVHLNIRFPDGQTLQANFSVTNTLGSVKNYVDEKQGNGIGSYDLAIPYPRKVFTAQDMNKALSELGLVNREALIVVPHHPTARSFMGQSSSSSSSSVPVNTLNGTDSLSDNSGGYFGHAKRILSYMNPFSYWGSSAISSNLGQASDGSLWQYRPNPTIQNHSSGPERSYSPYSPNHGTPPTGENVGRGKKATTTRIGGNIHTLKHDEDDSSFSDRNAFWNGNSTQYGGDNNK